ncbi:MAG TPA: hypothetical protein VHV29_14805 [Terriglobales bacterium]|nr:hypothetical protein [Terriglobales bacterium]
MLILSMLLGVLRLNMLLFAGMLLLLIVPLLLTCVLLLLTLLGPLLLTMLFRLSLLVLGLFLFRMAPVFVPLVMLRIQWCRDSD